MRTIFAAMGIVLVGLVLCGMGGLGSGPEGTVPETKENIRVRLTDRAGVSTELTQFSMGGEVFLTGRRGDGEITVFFKHLDRVDFDQVVGQDVPADLVLDSKEKIHLLVRKRTLFYGNTGYGAFRIQARDIKTIEFLEAAG
jgi:hypothetical protein